MNSLSWLIYLADVCDNVDWVFSLITVLMTIAFIVWGLVGMAASDTETDPDFWKGWRKIGWVVPASALAAILLGSVVPSKETIYAIAASEMGEKALNTQTGGKAVKALNVWLDRQINGEQQTVGAEPTKADDMTK